MTRQTCEKNRKAGKFSTTRPRAFFRVLFLKKTVVAHVCDVRAGSDRQTEARESAADGMGA